MTLAAGTTIGPYQIIAPIGVGGMGEVYRARDSRLNRDVAIKVLPESLASDPDRLARFAREAQLLAALNHPNIALVYGLEQSGVTRALTMELVEGPTLEDRIARQGAMPVSEAVDIARQICVALEAAHERGIIHRDLKPANIKVRADGTVKVLDFGLAKATAGGSMATGDLSASPTITSPAMTAAGIVLGTAAYMAPEQARGRAVDKRADIWAVGAILYELLTGRRAFAGDDVSEVMASVIRSEPDWSALAPDTPAAVRTATMRCLRKDPAERIHDAGDLRLALAGAFESAPSSTSLAPAPSPAMGWLWPAIALLLALAAAGVSLVHFREQPPAVNPVRFDVLEPRAPVARSVPALSPDGRSMAFLGRGTGTQGLMIWNHSFDTGEDHEIAATALTNVDLPFWSPDGRFIAFFSTGKLNRIDLAGTTLQTICEGPQGTLSRGGTWNEDDVIVFGQFGGGLMRVPAGGGVPVALTTLDTAAGELEHGGPAFLPDGRHFLYQRRTAAPGQGGIYLGTVDMKPDDPRPPRLVATEYGARYAPGPSPERGHILFLRQGTLLAQPFDAASLKITGEATPVVDHVADNGRQTGVFSVSRSGVLIYQQGLRESSTMVWVDRGGHETGAAVREPLTTPRFPRLSPDGQRLALTVAGDIWVHDIAGRPPIRITSDGDNFETAWSHDGKRLVYETSTGTLSAVAADGSGGSRTIVTAAGHTHAHAFTPDDREILGVAIGAQPTGADIVAFPADGSGQTRPIVRTPAREGFDGMSLSPDGRWIAYTSDTTGQTEIWMQAYPAGGAPIRISPNGGFEPVWSRKGDELYYIEGRRLMAVAVRTLPAFDFKPAVPLFDSRYEHDSQPPTYDVSADGRFLMIKPEQSDRPSTKVVLNWRELLKRAP